MEDPHNLAEEVAQKTFIAVHKKIEHLRNPERFKSWLFRIAVNYCNEEGRRKQKWDSRYVRNSHTEDAKAWLEIESHEPSPYRQTHQKDLSFWILRALNQLSPDQRSVLILKEYQGLKFREIAEALEISENTAKSRMYAGIQHMRQYLDRKKITKESLRYEL